MSGIWSIRWGEYRQHKSFCFPAVCAGRLHRSGCFRNGLLWECTTGCSSHTPRENLISSSNITPLQAPASVAVTYQVVSAHVWATIFWQQALQRVFVCERGQIFLPMTHSSTERPAYWLEVCNFWCIKSHIQYLKFWQPFLHHSLVHSQHVPSSAVESPLPERNSTHTLHYCWHTANT